MFLKAFHVRNFRRLKDVFVTVEKDKTIFVGANNSGKTSAAEIFSLFLGDRRDRFSIHDFSATCCSIFDSISPTPPAGPVEPPNLPTIELDLWLEVEKGDIHRVVHLLPDLDWKSAPVGVRLRFAPKDSAKTVAAFRECYATAASKAIPGDPFKSWPTSLTEYLGRTLDSEYAIYYYALDRSRFSDTFVQEPAYLPLPLGDETGRKGESIVAGLVRVDFLSAQRYQSDGKSRGRSETLSTRFSRFYSKNLTQRELDLDATRALANSEQQLNVHLSSVFKETISSLSKLGYPGVSNPEVLIRSVLNPSSILSESAQVHYVLKGDNQTDSDLVLPDQYNGLGFKNLIYMVVEVLDYHQQWMKQDVDRALIHIIVIEEPEAHLHAQLQQVFINNILNVVPESSLPPGHHHQLIVTTHSPHIIYESGFIPIRYFRRSGGLGKKQLSVVLDMSLFYGSTDPRLRDFLQRYMKVTHCDLFFADAAILVEGNVERLLLPLMIQTSAEALRSRYLSVLEVGGAYAHMFRTLIEFLGLPTLVITDIDSVISGATDDDPLSGDADQPVRDEESDLAAKTCSTVTADAITSNQTLVQWLPRLTAISDLFSATDLQKTQLPTSVSPATVRVVYQKPRNVTWNGETQKLAGRTLEEDFALENLTWCQDVTRKDLRLRISKADELSLTAIAEKVFLRVNRSRFPKTEFALALINYKRADWKVPLYIDEGLKWLAEQFAESASPSPAASTPTTITAL